MKIQYKDFSPLEFEAQLQQQAVRVIENRWLIRKERIAEMCIELELVKKIYEIGLRFYNRAIEHLSKPSKELKLAEKYFYRAAICNHIKAQYFLGIVLFRQDRFEESKYWLKKASDNQFRHAQEVLKVIFF